MAAAVPAVLNRVSDILSREGVCPAFHDAVRNDFPCVKKCQGKFATSGCAIAEQRALNPSARFGDALAQSAVRCNTSANYESQWQLFSAFCAIERVPRIASPPDLLSVEVIQAVGSLVAGRLAERVPVAFLGWLAMMRKGDGYWYKSSSITKYVQNVRRIMEQRCGMQFGSGGIPATRYRRWCSCRGLFSGRWRTGTKGRCRGLWWLHSTSSSDVR
jgi:hypothetical protein